MSEEFFKKPILNSPYECPTKHWELDDGGQPTQKINNSRRLSKLISPIPKPKKRKKADKQQDLALGDSKGSPEDEQKYNPTP